MGKVCFFFINLSQVELEISGQNAYLEEFCSFTFDKWRLLTSKIFRTRYELQSGAENLSPKQVIPYRDRHSALRTPRNPWWTGYKIVELQKSIHVKHWTDRASFVYQQIDTRFCRNMRRFCPQFGWTSFIAKMRFFVRISSLLLLPHVSFFGHVDFHLILTNMDNGVQSLMRIQKFNVPTLRLRTDNWMVW